MIIGVEIMRFAYSKMSPFNRKELLDYLNSVTEKVSENSINVSLSRLVASGKLIRTGLGQYTINKEVKPEYIYKPNDEERMLANSIRQKFPFTSFCIWRPTALAHFMLHIPVVEAVFVDVERVALDSMLSHLQQQNLGCQILLNPSTQECERYLTNEKMIVIRPLTGETPTTICEGITVPTLEKMLVDAAIDKELAFAQGAEIYNIYTNAFEQYDINKSRLLRYASRRNRKAVIEEILTKIF